MWWKGSGSVGGGRFLLVNERVILVVVNFRLLIVSEIRSTGSGSDVGGIDSVEFEQ